MLSIEIVLPTMKRFTSKTAIVTGSSRGIGAHLAGCLAREGAKVVVNYSGNRETADRVVANIVAEGGQAVGVQADISRAADVTRLFDVAIARFGKVDLLVNNAGIMTCKRIEDTSDEDFDRMFGINVRGTFFMLREAAKRLEPGGRIVNMSSSVTRLMLPTYGAYAATKAAVEQLTRVFAKEVGARGITVNSVSPGPTNTELFHVGKTQETIQKLSGMSALGRIGEPDDIARVVLFLLSDEAGWVSAQNIGANGGFA